MEKPAMRAPQPDAMTSSALRAVALALAVATATACSSESANPSAPLSPATPAFAGTWVGAVRPAAVAGNLQLTLAPSLQLPSGPALDYAGTWTIAFPSAGDNTAGMASGRTLGTVLTVTLRPSDPEACPYALSGTLDGSGTRLTGTLGPVGCSGGVSAPLTLVKQ
jgi:hypothetical protein